MMYMLSVLFTFFSYMTSNPFISALSLMMSLLAISPMLSLMNQVWYIYLMVMVFLSGVFVLVVYVSSMGGWSYKKVIFNVFFIVLMLFFYPYLVTTLSVNSIAFLLNPYYLGLVFYVIIFLTFMVLFLSYMLSYGSAMRKF